jgi:hypothetical protein
MFGFLKKRQNGPEITGLPAVEKEVAFEVAQIAGVMMREQFRVAAAMVSADRKDEIVFPSQAFAFGALVVALQGKGISWDKSPYVSIRFAEIYMPDYGDHKELAKIILHFGMEPSCQKYRAAGELAFARFSQSEEGTRPPFADDLARAVGLG